MDLSKEFRYKSPQGINCNIYVVIKRAIIHHLEKRVHVAKCTRERQTPKFKPSYSKRELSRRVGRIGENI